MLMEYVVDKLSMLPKNCGLICVYADDDCLFAEIVIFHAQFKMFWNDLNASWEFVEFQGMENGYSC